MESPPADDWLTPARYDEPEPDVLTLGTARKGRHEPSPVTRLQVKNAMAFGLTVHQVAVLMQVSEGTLRKYYTDELQYGAAEKLQKVAANMFRIAISGEDKVAANVGMEILRRRGGELWRDPDKRVSLDVTTPPPIIDSSKLTFDERQQMKKIIHRVMTKELEAPDGTTE